MNKSARGEEELNGKREKSERRAREAAKHTQLSTWTPPSMCDIILQQGGRERGEREKGGGSWGWKIGRAHV